MTHKIIHLSILTAALTFAGSIAQASQGQSAKTTEPVVKLVQKDTFVSIPLNTNFTIKGAPRINRDLSEDYDTDYVSKIEYDLLGNVDANFGLIKTKNVKSRYRVKPALQPRGRYHKRVNSTLGAGITSKF